MNSAILLACFAVMYMVLIVPKQRQQKKQTQMLASLEPGDEVLLNSGIFGFISTVEENVLWVEVAEDVELKVARSSVSGLVREDADGATENDADDEVEA